MAPPEGRAGGPKIRSRHVGSAIVLLGIALFATWNVVHNDNWIEVVLPFSPQYRADVSGAGVIAVVCWAGGLGLLARTTVGLWLGRLEAAALLVLGVSIGWDGVVHPRERGVFGDPLLISVTAAVLLIGAGVGMLVALRPGADRRATEQTWDLVRAGLPPGWHIGLPSHPARHRWEIVARSPNRGGRGAAPPDYVIGEGPDETAALIDLAAKLGAKPAIEGAQ